PLAVARRRLRRASCQPPITTMLLKIRMAPARTSNPDKPITARRFQTAILMRRAMSLYPRLSNALAIAQASRSVTYGISSPGFRIDHPPLCHLPLLSHLQSLFVSDTNKGPGDYAVKLAVALFLGGPTVRVSISHATDTPAAL